MSAGVNRLRLPSADSISRRALPQTRLPTRFAALNESVRTIVESSNGCDSFAQRLSRYGATTPALLKWFAAFNRGREYPDQVKPFNFLNAYHARLQFELPDAEQWRKPKRGRPKKQLDLKPVSAFNKIAREAEGRI
jgi:hypothetical protein